MSEQQTAPRPRQVTLAAIVALTASVLLVLGLFDTMGGIRSEENRAAIEDFLAEPPGSGLGLDAGQVVGLMRVLVFVTAGVATAVAVLAVFVLQRHRGARIAFTVAAGALLLTAPVSGLLPFMVAVAAALLWSAPARAWFAGRPYTPPEPPPRPSTGAAAGPPTGPSAGPAAGPPPADLPAGGPDPARDRPRPHPSFGSQPPGPGDSPAAAHPPYPSPGPGPAHPPGYPPAYPPPSAGPDLGARRPVTVTLGVGIALAVTGLVTMLFAAVAVMLAVAGDRLVDEAQRDPNVARLDVPREQLVASLWVGLVVVLVWCVAAIALAVLTYLRKGWARILLTGSGGVAVLGCLLAGLAGVVLAMLIVPALVLLYAGGANQWFARRPDRSPPAGPYPPYPPYPPSPPSPPPGRPGPW